MGFLLVSWSGWDSIPNQPNAPRDSNQLAKAIVDIAPGDVPPEVDSEPTTASQFVRSGGLRGGRARADRPSEERHKEIAREAAASRWRKNDDGSSGSE